MDRYATFAPGGDLSLRVSDLAVSLSLFGSAYYQVLEFGREIVYAFGRNGVLACLTYPQSCSHAYSLRLQ